MRPRSIALGVMAAAGGTVTWMQVRASLDKAFDLGRGAVAWAAASVVILGVAWMSDRYIKAAGGRARSADAWFAALCLVLGVLAWCVGWAAPRPWGPLVFPIAPAVWIGAVVWAGQVALSVAEKAHHDRLSRAFWDGVVDDENGH